MRLFIDWGLLLFSALTRSCVAQYFPPSLPQSLPPLSSLPPCLVFFLFCFFSGPFSLGLWVLGRRAVQRCWPGVGMTFLWRVAVAE